MLIFSLLFSELQESCFHACEMQFSPCKNLTQRLSVWFDCICVFINIIETCSFPQVFTGLSLINWWDFFTLHVSITELGQFIHEIRKSWAEEGKIQPIQYWSEVYWQVGGTRQWPLKSLFYSWIQASRRNLYGLKWYGLKKEGSSKRGVDITLYQLGPKLWIEGDSWCPKYVVCISIVFFFF